MKYHLNRREVSYEADGSKISGDNKILLKEAIDLTNGKPWSDNGYIIRKFLSESAFEKFEAETKNLLLSLWEKSGLSIPKDFDLNQYHTLAFNQNLHLSAVDKTKLLSVSDFPTSISEVEKRISEICETALIAKNPFDSQSAFHFRVVRPDSNDNNPLHRDVWLEDYANCINLYIPIAGSNELSSLAIVPGSHHWPESKVERTKDGASIDGIKFNVPAVTSISGEYEIVRPNPQKNEVLVFSPYLIHGGAVNLSPNQTRISIELRLWKKN
jgi:ectoine hydroxylase-related dioxygenase (phytanoyl-CoA dioxygenase family)